MKKFIAALLVVAMVVSAFSAALAADKYLCWIPEEYDETDGARSRILVEAKEGDTISCYIKWTQTEDTDFSQLRLYSREYSAQSYKNVDKNGVAYGSSWHIQKNGLDEGLVKQYGDWYYFEIVVKGTGISEIIFDHELVPKANISDVYFAGVAVNGTYVAADKVTGGTDKGSDTFKQVADVEIGAEATTPTTGDDTTGDTTGGTSGETKPAKTGVVSAAVVAAVAVLGGAVVLKKKEF